MTEAKITKVKYVIQIYLKDIDKWSNSDWNDGLLDKDTYSLDYMLLLVKQARESMARCVTPDSGLTHKKYRLVKQTHSITTEVVDE